VAGSTPTGPARASVVAPVSEGIAAGVSKHVRVNALELGCFPSARRAPSRIVTTLLQH
jgi:hypothetical protein